MATKTLILRPTSVTANDESLVSLYPSDTTMTNAHTLVNEEIADDDATYVSLTGAGAEALYYFKYNKPDDLVSIINITITLKEKLESGSNVGSLYFYINSRSRAMGNTTGSLNTTEYNFRTYNPTTDTALEEIISDLSNATPDTEIYIKRYVNTNSSKASPFRTTQVYIEITYEAAEPSALFIKKDNVWSSINYTKIYHKYNDSWVSSDTSILQNNTKYIIKEVE